MTEIHCAVFGRTNGALVSMVNVAEVDAGRQPTRIGLLGRIGRTADGRRCFSEADLGWLLLLSRLRATGMPVRDMVRYAGLVRSQAGKQERLELLQRHRGRVGPGLLEQQECRKLPGTKIGIYRSRVPAAKQRRDRAELTCATFHWAGSPSRRRALAAWA